MLTAIDIPSGFYRNGTDMQAMGRWRDGNFVRFRDNVVRPIGGWTALASSAFAAKPRGAYLWRTNAGVRWFAAGTYNKLYVSTMDGTVSDITPAGLSSGAEVAAINTGYGGGNYGDDLYGTPRDDNTTFTEATAWQLDQWGENLLAVSVDDGDLYEWALNTGTPAATVSNAPTSNSGVVVTEERFVMCLGAGGNPRKVQWCDREDNTTWSPAATNEAGDVELQTSGELLQGVRVRGQVLLLTSVDAFTATPGVGAYGFQRIDNASGAVSRMAGAGLNGNGYWMSGNGFFRYAGGVAERIPCDVSDYVFTNLNTDYKSHIWAVANRDFGEVWWFYPSTSATEIDSYVAHQVDTGIWFTGSLERTAGTDSGAFRYPLWATEDLYQHEFGWAHGSGSAFIESGPIFLDQGERTVSVLSLIPDEKTQGGVTATFKARFYPNAAETEYGPYDMSNPTDVRFSGRQFRLRLTGDNQTDWRSGIHRVEVKARGKR